MKCYNVMGGNTEKVLCDGDLQQEWHCMLSDADWQGLGSTLCEDVQVNCF